MWPGQCLSIEMDEVLFEGKSDFQDIKVFKSKAFGTVMTLDGVIQVTEKDEFSYQEMIAHIPLFSHPNPKKVLVIGGGDGGAVREVARHPEVELIEQCEIDEMVIDVSKKFLPTLAAGYLDPRVKVNIGDGLVFVKERTAMYDVIIVDSSDPVGPADSLFGPDFYNAVHNALAPGGIVCSQCENVWLHLDLIKEMRDMCTKIFPRVEYAYVCIPTYPGGQIGFLLSGKEGASACATPVRQPSEEFLAKLKYYEPAVHAAAFVLPRFARQRLSS